jgi:hypothetical protein
MIEEVKEVNDSQMVAEPEEPITAVSDEIPQPAEVAQRESSWWRVGDFGVLGLWLAIVGFILPYHEKWADEAQAWLIARDLPLSRIWFYELRYEGSPGLWHTILWIAQHWFHAKYSALGYIGMAGAAAGVALLIFKAPFPRYIRWPLAFTYFMVYQYAVIARPYTLFALFALIAAFRYKDLKHPAIFALSLVPLAMLTAHGGVLAGGLAIVYAWRFVSRWRRREGKTRRSFLISAVGVGAMYVFLFFVLLPPADVEATHHDAISATIFLHRVLGVIGGALVDNGWASLFILCVLAGWSYSRKALAPLLVPVILLVVLYVYASGWPHFQGTVFISILVGLAIAWPDETERGQFCSAEIWRYWVMVSALGVVIAYQIYAGVCIIRNEMNLPYTGAEDMARYLRPMVDQGKTIAGFQYGMVAVNANFDHNIFENWPRSYYHHSLSEFKPEYVADEMRTSRADYIVTNWWDPWDEQKFTEGLVGPMGRWGYSLDHFSDGYLLTKRGYSHRQIYFVFRKTEP